VKIAPKPGRARKVAIAAWLLTGAVVFGLLRMRPWARPEAG
jgi:hypothetical protein